MFIDRSSEERDGFNQFVMKLSSSSDIIDIDVKHKAEHFLPSPLRQCVASVTFYRSLAAPLTSSMSMESTKGTKALDDVNGKHKRQEGTRAPSTKAQKHKSMKATLTASPAEAMDSFNKSFVELGSPT
jgi:hypothetical protein